MVELGVLVLGACDVPLEPDAIVLGTYVDTCAVFSAALTVDMVPITPPIIIVETSSSFTRNFLFTKTGKSPFLHLTFDVIIYNIIYHTIIVIRVNFFFDMYGI